MRTIAFGALTLFLLTSAAYAQEPPDIGYYSLAVAYDEEVYAEGVIADGGMPTEIHTYDMDAGLQSPSGRLAYGRTATGRVSLRLPIGEEYGEYRMSTVHWVWCTYWGTLLAGVRSDATATVPKRFRIQMRSFIRAPTVGPVPMFCYSPIYSENVPLTGKGDGRYFDERPHASYRSQSLLLVEPDRGRLYSASHLAGATRLYAIDIEDDTDENGEPKLNDCIKLHTISPGDASSMSASASPVGVSTNRTVRTRVFGAARSTGAPVPDIDWNFTFDIQTYSGQSYTMNPSWHDCYPSYEFYVGSQGVYGYFPPRNDWPYIIGCLGTLPGFSQFTFGPYSGGIN